MMPEQHLREGSNTTALDRVCQYVGMLKLAMMCYD